MAIFILNTVVKLPTAMVTLAKCSCCQNIRLFLHTLNPGDQMTQAILPGGPQVEFLNKIGYHSMLARAPY